VAAAATPTMPAPPGGATPSGVGASPSSATPNPKAKTATAMMIGIVQGVRWYADNFPKAAKAAKQINDLVPELQRAAMEGMQPGEPMAPPVNG
jgi:hypothetical protein